MPCAFSFLIWPGGSAPTALAGLLFPPDPQIIGKTQCFATFLTFRAPVSSFFWLFLFLSSTLLSSALLSSTLLSSTLLSSTLLSSTLLLFSLLLFSLLLFYSSLFYSSLFYSSLLSDSSHLCFSSLHIVGSLTTKLPLASSTTNTTIHPIKRG